MTTKADLIRFDALRRYGCIACRIMGWYGLPDMHHIVDNGYRALSGGNAATLPLCPYHHRGNIPEGYTVASAAERFGPSLAHSKRDFIRRFGTERALLDKVNADLESTHFKRSPVKS